MYEYFAPGFVVASVRPLLVVSDWGVVWESSVSVVSIRFDRHIFPSIGSCMGLLGLGGGGW